MIDERAVVVSQSLRTIIMAKCPSRRIGHGRSYGRGRTARVTIGCHCGSSLFSPVICSLHPKKFSAAHHDEVASLVLITERVSGSKLYSDSSLFNLSKGHWTVYLESVWAAGHEQRKPEYGTRTVDWHGTRSLEARLTSEIRV